MRSELLGGSMLRLRDIMTTRLATLTPDVTLHDAVAVLADNHVGGAPVVRGDKVVGLLSATDLLTYLTDIDGGPPSDSLHRRRTSLDEVTVSELMTRDVKSMSPDCSVEQAADFMGRNQIHRVLVMEGNRLLGIVTTTDVAKAVAEHRIRTNTYVFG